MRLETPPLSPPHAGCREARVVDPLEVDDLVAERLKHAADLPVATFVDTKPDFVTIRKRHVCGFFRCGNAIVERYAPSHHIDLMGLDRIFRAHAIELVDLIARVHESMCELSVVGEQEYAYRVAIETPDREQAVFLFPRDVDEIHHGSPVTWIVRRRDGIGRLVDKDVEVSMGRNPAAVHLHLILVGDVRGEFPDDGAIDLDLARFYQPVGVTTGADPCARDVSIEPISTMASR